MIIGTAGHIDHGKTSLVRALTGVDTDRLKEEKARGISIELGFAYLPTPSGEIIGFVDAPGHERFIHTMLAGASGVDFVVLVVAADDGVMPQTREHLAIVDLLGLRRGAVALTKIDSVAPERVGQVRADIEDLLSSSGLAGAEVAPVSVVTGEGVDEFRARLFAASAETQARATDGAFRFAVDRSFTLSGTGTVVTGVVHSGEVAIGDPVIISPTGLSARVRSIHAQNRAAERGRAGERCALNLAGVGISKDAAARGDFVLAPDLHAPTGRIDVSVRLLRSETKSLAQWTPVRLHHAACDVAARVVPLGDGPVRPGQEALIQLVLENRSRPRSAIDLSCATRPRNARSAAARSSTCARPRASAGRPHAWACCAPAPSKTGPARLQPCWTCRPSSSTSARSRGIARCATLKSKRSRPRRTSSASRVPA